MRKRSLYKDMFREISRTRARFLSIFLLSALAVAFLSGLRTTEPNMNRTGDDYLDACGMHDIRIVSTLGISPEDVEAAAALPRVDRAEGSRSVDILASRGDTTLALKTISLSENRINDIRLVEGRLPRQDNECLMDALMHYEIGDTFRVEGVSSGSEDCLTGTQYTVVGICHSPLYLTFSRGTTSIGDGSLDGYLYLLPSAYHMDYYTDLYLVLKDSVGLNAFENTYRELLDGFTEDREDWAKDRAARRTDSIRSDAEAAISEAEQEYREAEEEVNGELADAEKELADARRKLDDGYREYRDGENELTDAIAQGEQQIADSEKKLEEAEQKLAQGEKEWQKGYEELNRGRVTYRENYALWEAGEEEYAAGLSQWQEGARRYEEALGSWQEEKARYEEGLASLQGQSAALREQREARDLAWQEHLQRMALLEQYEGEDREELLAREAAAEQSLTEQEAVLKHFEEELAAGEAELQAGKALLDAGETQLEESRLELEASRVPLDQARQELDGAKAQLEAAAEQLRQGEEKAKTGAKELDTGRQQLQTGMSALAEARSQLKEQSAEGRRKLNEARQELEDGEAEYADGLRKYEEGRQEAEEKLGEARQELQEAREELDSLEEAEWYVLTRFANAGFAGYAKDSENMGNLARVFPLIFFLVAALVVLTTMTRMVEEQRTTIGSLKALGYSSRDVSRKYIGYGFLASFFGSLFGLAVGCTTIPYVIIRCWQIMYSIPRVLFTPCPAVYLFSAGTAVAVTVLTVLSAALNALRSTPAALMRPRAPQAGRTVFLERIPFLWSRLSFIQKVTARNLLRYRKRFWMTVLGIGGCTALLITGLGLNDSISNVIGIQYKEITRYHAAASLAAEDREALTEYLRGEEDVAACSLVHAGTLDLTGASRTVSGIFYALEEPEDLTEMMELRTRRGHQPVPVSDRGILICEKLSILLDLKVGDTVLLEEDSRATATVTGIVENYVQNYIYMTADFYEELFGRKAEVNTALIRFREDSPAAANALGEKLLSRELVSSFSHLQTSKESIEQSFGTINYAVFIVIISAAALAFVVLFNLSSINITERRRELATLRVLGFGPREMNAYVLRENLVLTLIGSFLGLFLGKWLHAFVIQTVEVEMVMFGRDADPSSYVLAVALTFLFSLIVGFIAGRRLRQIDMVESLKAVE